MELPNSSVEFFLLVYSDYSSRVLLIFFFYVFFVFCTVYRLICLTWVMTGDSSCWRCSHWNLRRRSICTCCFAWRRDREGGGGGLFKRVHSPPPPSFLSNSLSAQLSHHSLLLSSNLFDHCRVRFRVLQPSNANSLSVSSSFSIDRLKLIRRIECLRGAGTTPCSDGSVPFERMALPLHTENSGLQYF